VHPGIPASRAKVEAAVSDPAVAEGGIRHALLLYRTPGERDANLDDFVRAALAAGDPVLIAVPATVRGRFWAPGSESVTVAEMADLGTNPARMLTVLRTFAAEHAGRRIRYLAEPAWPGRPAAELHELARHEALLNVAFADAKVTMLCLYDEAALPRSVISHACSAHPVLRRGERDVPNPDYTQPAEYLAGLDKPLVPPADAAALTYTHDLRPVRALVATFARQSGLPPARCTDLVIAASEVAANTLRHTTGAGVVRLWSTDAEVLCQLDDFGLITDPLAGHWRHDRNLPGGQGLWLVNQVCDLAEISSTSTGTSIRLHMYRH
jgi:anti-sigma regulatory factor (Ser/Thr protein kinase)